MKILRVIDVETSGAEATDEVIEIGIVHLNIETGEIRRFTDRLFGASAPLTAEVRAVHHISDAMIEGKPLFKDAGDEAIHGQGWFAANTIAFGAHNSRFEAMFIGDDLRRDLPLLCSYKCALIKWPDAPKHTNQVLRYWLGLYLRDEDCQPPHRALPDAWVTAHIFRELLRQGMTLEEMIDISSKPAMPFKIAFGKHKGKEWRHVETDYLRWIIDKSDFDEDTKAYAEIIANERQTYFALAIKAADTAKTVDDLVTWFRDEAKQRSQYGLIDGSKEYQALVQACAIRRRNLETMQSDLAASSNDSPTTEKNNAGSTLSESG